MAVISEGNNLLIEKAAFLGYSVDENGDILDPQGVPIPLYSRGHPWPYAHILGCEINARRFAAYFKSGTLDVQPRRDRDEDLFDLENVR